MRSPAVRAPLPTSRHAARAIPRTPNACSTDASPATCSRRRRTAASRMVGWPPSSSPARARSRSRTGCGSWATATGRGAGSPIRCAMARRSSTASTRSRAARTTRGTSSSRCTSTPSDRGAASLSISTSRAARGCSTSVVGPVPTPCCWPNGSPSSRRMCSISRPWSGSRTRSSRGTAWVRAYGRGPATTRPTTWEPGTMWCCSRTCCTRRTPRPASPSSRRRMQRSRPVASS